MKLFPIYPLLVIDKQEAVSLIDNTNAYRKEHGLELIEEEDDDIFNIITAFASSCESGTEVLVFKPLIVSKDFLTSNIPEPMSYMLISRAATEIIQSYCELTNTELTVNNMLTNSYFIMGLLYQQYYEAKENFNRKRH